jgi:hypothetical protein
VEELRFAPGFFAPSASGYWSYAFAWWLDDTTPIDNESLANALTIYFRGLCVAVGEGMFSFDVDHFDTTLTEDRPSREQSGTTHHGQIETYDPFTTGEPLTLEVNAHVFMCGQHQVVLLGASPKAESEPIWAALVGVLGSFQCH